MRELLSKTIFVFFDTLMIILSLYLAYLLRTSWEGLHPHTITFSTYLHFYPLYIIPLLLFTYEGIYSYRYDFWHESRLILKAVIFSAILLFAYLAMTKSIEHYSRLVIGLSFFTMAILIPLAKNITKKTLYRIGLWRKKALIYGDDRFLQDEIYHNPYLGYVSPKHPKEPSTVFINSQNTTAHSLKDIIADQIKRHHEVIFIPLIDDYNLTHSHIYELSNTRTNLIVFRNRLKSRYRLILKNISDILLSLLIFPLLIVGMLLIALAIKLKEPHSSILFRQKRLGKHGKPFTCYKFRTMADQGDRILEAYLATHPEEVAHYAIYHKYQNDPRITPIGDFLRRTSLDELPQILNVIKREMSFIGPRPYILTEEPKMNKLHETILSVKPGITGLWQVSGRSDVDFKSRLQLDVWYIRNWNLWMDLVILIKTIKTVLHKGGAV